jgi:hypothetical protein
VVRIGVEHIDVAVLIDGQRAWAEKRLRIIGYDGGGVGVAAGRGWSRLHHLSYARGGKIDVPAGIDGNAERADTALDDGLVTGVVRGLGGERGPG